MSFWLFASVCGGWSSTSFHAHTVRKNGSKRCPARSHGAKEGMALFRGRQSVLEAPAGQIRLSILNLICKRMVCARNDTRGDSLSLDQKDLPHTDAVHSSTNKKPTAPGAPSLGRQACGVHRDAAHPSHIAKRAARDTYHHDRTSDDAPELVAHRSTLDPLQSGQPTHDQHTPPNPVEFQRIYSQPSWQIDVWLLFDNSSYYFLKKN